MKRQEQKEQTRRLLLDTTKAIIAEKGCSRATLSDIMERSGLSKGAIFHHVKGKDELFALVLRDSLAGANDRFFGAVERTPGEFENPMRQVESHLAELEDPVNLTNKIFIYLLGRSDQPAVQEMVERFYDYSVDLSESWIRAGQEKGVIRPSVDARKAGEQFTLVSLGIRMRSVVGNRAFAFGTDDYAAYIRDMLKQP